MTRRWFAVACVAALLPSGESLAEGGRVLATIDCPAEEPTGMVFHEGALWISDMQARQILKVRPSDGHVLGRLEATGLMPTGLDWREGVLYSADRRRDAIARRRPAEGTDLSPLPYYERWATGVAHDGELLWVVDGRSQKLHALDPDDGTTVKSFPAPAKAPTGLTFDGEYLWVADHGADELYRVDRRDGSVIAILSAPGPYPSALAYDGESLWVADYQTSKVQRVELLGETPYVEDQERRARVSYEVLYRARGDGAIEGLEVFVALPRDIPGQHLLGELVFDPEPSRFESDRWGQKVAVFEVGRVASGETRRVGWRGDFSLFRVRFQVRPEAVDAGTFPETTKAYLADDRKYDLDSKTVGDLVTKLTAGERGTYRRARVIYEHLTEVIEYDRSSGWNNAATVLERGTGSCSEYTFALVALLRRAGIPARYVGALSERGDEASFDDVFHRWAEVYLPGYGWVPVDANAGHGRLPGEKGQYFGGRSNRHVVTTIGGGASRFLEWTYNHNETYRVSGAAELEIRPIARFRPLEGGPAAEPHEAPPVLVPRLAAPAETTPAASDAARAGGPERLPFGALLAAIVLVFVVLGLVLLRARRR